MKKALFYTLYILVLVYLIYVFINIDNNSKLSHYDELRTQYEIEIPHPDNVIHYQENFVFQGSLKYSVYEYNDKNLLLNFEWNKITDKVKMELYQKLKFDLKVTKEIPNLEEIDLYYYEENNKKQNRLYILWNSNSNIIYVIDEKV